MTCVTERCLLSAERGDNSCMMSERLSWYYDASSGTCVQFVYAGCGGNENRFETEVDCRAACVGVDDSVARGLGKLRLEVSLYWEFPWIPWSQLESHWNGNRYASFMGMGMA